LKRRNLKSLALALILAASTTTSISPVAAVDTQITAHIDWSGVNITLNTSLSQSIKPLNVPPRSSGQVDWSLYMGNARQTLWPSFSLSNSGSARFGFGDVPVGSKVQNVGTAFCNLSPRNSFGDANTAQSNCSAFLMPVAGETYTFLISPIKINGSQWWEGSVRIQSTGEVIQLGRLENNPSQAVLSGSQNSSGYNQISLSRQPLPACSDMPDFSAVFGSLKISTGSASSVNRTRKNQICPGISTIDSTSLPGSYIVNIGNVRLNQETPKATPTQSTNTAKPVRPTFSLVNFTGNKVNINVDLGSGANKPDQIYLIAPKIGATEAKKVFGKISGNIATWSFSLSNLISGDLIPMKIVSLKKGIESDSLEENFTFPGLSSVISNKAVPVAPKNITSRVVGTSGIVTTSATAKVGAVAKSAYLFGSSLGISPGKALKGEVIGTKVVFEIPIKSSMAGKTYSFTIYFENDAGKSAPVQGKISIPGLPKISTEGLAIPEGTVVGKTILCSKGSQARSFVARACPPGWKKT